MYRKLYMWVAPPPVVGFLYVLEANRTGLRKTVHHTKKEFFFQYRHGELKSGLL